MDYEIDIQLLKSHFLILSILNVRNMGRYDLSDHLGITKSKTRSLLNQLKEKGLVGTPGKSSGRTGTSITHSGRQIVEKVETFCKIEFEDPDYISDSLYITYDTRTNDYNQEQEKIRRVVFLNLAKNVLNGIDERDSAIRAGAKGAITLKLENNTWCFLDKTPISNYNHRFNPPYFKKIYTHSSIASGKSESVVFNALTEIVFFHFQEKIIEILT